MGQKAERAYPQLPALRGGCSGQARVWSQRWPGGTCLRVTALLLSCGVILEQSISTPGVSASFLCKRRRMHDDRNCLFLPRSCVHLTWRRFSRGSGQRRGGGGGCPSPGKRGHCVCVLGGLPRPLRRGTSPWSPCSVLTATEPSPWARPAAGLHRPRSPAEAPRAHPGEGGPEARGQGRATAAFGKGFPRGAPEPKTRRVGRRRRVEQKRKSKLREGTTGERTPPGRPLHPFLHLPRGSRWLTGLVKIGTGALEAWNVLHGEDRGGADDQGKQ